MYRKTTREVESALNTVDAYRSSKQSRSQRKYSEFVTPGLINLAVPKTSKLEAKVLRSASVQGGLGSIKSFLKKSPRRMG